MITLIGFRCTHRKMFSQEVLIDRVFSQREWRFEYRNNLLFTAYGGFVYLKNHLEVLFWWFNGGVTPVLIPNTEVKLASGDGTHLYRWGE